MNQEKLVFHGLNEDGTKVEYEALFTFESEETNKNYIVYTDNTLDQDGNTKVYASIYEPSENEMQLTPITTEKEWKIIQIILDELQGSIKRKGAEN